MYYCRTRLSGFLPAVSHFGVPLSHGAVVRSLITCPLEGGGFPLSERIPMIANRSILPSGIWLGIVSPILFTCGEMELKRVRLQYSPSEEGGTCSCLLGHGYMDTRCVEHFIGNKDPPIAIKLKDARGSMLERESQTASVRLIRKCSGGNQDVLCLALSQPARLYYDSFTISPHSERTPAAGIYMS